MNSTRKKARRHDSIDAGELPYLWADDEGNINTKAKRRAGSSVLLLPRLQLSPRAAVRRARRLQLSRSFLSWLSSRSLDGAGYGKADASRFEMWLSLRLENCAFQCESVGAVLVAAGVELKLERWEAVALLLRVTRMGARFQSDGGIVSFR